ncbi:MAG TPA: FAD:protein FMN transferase [Candidatus Sumerlaeota bacterium]|nr:FAD:protein FMN transferase [Candidatus Sumerlaeota bacterium]
MNQMSLQHRNRRFLLAAALVIMAIAAPLVIRSRARHPHILIREQFLKLGTLVEISIPCPPEREAEAREAICAAAAEIDRLEVLWSRYRPDSDVSRINLAAGREAVHVSSDTLELVESAANISRITGGAFDISFASVGKLWRLKQDDPRIPSPEEIRESLPLVNFHNIIVNREEGSILLKDKGMMIDLGGIAKGAAVDRAIAVIRKQGFSHALVNAGGDIYAMGKNAVHRPWRVAVRHPRDRELFLGKVDLTGAAIVTSGDYERGITVDGRRYHHILDTHTGYPAEKCISVTVIAPDAMTADAIATALFVMGPHEGVRFVNEREGVESLIIGPDMVPYASSGFPRLSDPPEPAETPFPTP